MADQDHGPSLELPSFGRRRRKKAQSDAPEPSPSPEPEPETALPPVAEPEDTTPTEVLAPTPVEPEPETALAPAKAPKAPKPPKPSRQRTRWIGAAMIGLLSGFALVGLINATLRACDAARGTASCGGPGLFVLFIILALITLGATRLLRFWGFQDSGTVAFLGIALTAIVALVFLTAHLLSLTMVLVIPLITALAFVISDWISATMTEADQS